MKKAGAAASVAALFGAAEASTIAAESFAPPIVVFSKVYQELNLSLEDSAAITAEAGLAGVDCPVRPGGQILPEHARDELPRFTEALAQRGLRMPLITTGITSVVSPNTEELLRNAKKFAGAKYYRFGFMPRKKDVPVEKQLAEIRDQLKDLADLNKEIGIGGVIENHSGGNYLGGDLTELHQMVSEFDPAQIGVAFDIAHALITHGDQWISHFEKLKSHIRVAYVKDVRQGRFVRFGEGEVGRVGYFKLLKQLGYAAPVSIHIEYPWSEQGKSKTRDALVKVLKESAGVLKQWLAQA